MTAAQTTPTLPQAFRPACRCAGQQQSGCSTAVPPTAKHPPSLTASAPPPPRTPCPTQTDWYNVYQNPSVTPAIANLPWYSVVGNHEGPTQGGMDKLIYDYPAMNSNWQMPSRYYAVRGGATPTAASARMRMPHFLLLLLLSCAIEGTRLRPSSPQLNLIGNGVSVKILVLNVFPCITGASAAALARRRSRRVLYAAAPAGAAARACCRPLQRTQTDEPPRRSTAPTTQGTQP